MRIVLYCGGMPFNGDTPSKQSLGGSETAAWAVARELAKRQHMVTMFTRGEPGKFDGVTYENVGEIGEQTPLGANFEAYATSGPCESLIIQRHPMAFAKQYASKCNLFWTHDLALKRWQGLVAGTAWNCDRVVAVSEWHRQQIAATYEYPATHVKAVRNGIDLADFPHRHENFLSWLGTRPRPLFYSSRPERGLAHLVRPGGIMEQLGERFQLFVAGYDNTMREMMDFYRYLYGRCAELPNVTVLGHLTKRDLYSRMVESWMHVYPTEFEETSCITAMETQAAGLPILASKCGALPETLQGAGADLLDLKDGQADEAAFVERLRHYDANPKDWTRLQRKCDGARYAWPEAAEEWELLIEEVLAAKSADPIRLSRHYLEHEDITALHDLGQRVELDAAEKAALDSYGWRHDKAEYIQRYADYYAHERELHPLGIYDDVTNTPRAQTMLRELAERTKPGDKILDLGPAEGNFTIALARALPNRRFICVEIESGNVEAMNANLGKLNIQNVEVHVGDEDNLPEAARGAACILAAEVLEHIPDPAGAMQKMAEFVGGEPQVVLTVPFGPWAAMNVTNREWHGHLHHFEPDDLRELFGRNHDYRLSIVGAYHSPRGELLGNFVLGFKYNSLPGEINYARKHRAQAPRESISLCMIAGNAEDSIGAAIKSVQGLVDEVHVALDARSADATGEVARKLGANVFEIPSPLEIGFGEARNLSIAPCTTDWVLWMDADERLIYPERVNKYLRANPCLAYSVPQHHFAVEPAGLLKTDLPTRIFRNHGGVRFFGMVHEHPELKLNDGLAPYIVNCFTPADASILHYAYDTEATRRLRFRRNWPLMLREFRQEGPRRHLLTMLMVRDTAYLLRDFSFNNLPMPVEEVQIPQEQLGPLCEQMFHELISTKNLRMILDGLAHYSIANTVLKRGFNFGTEILGASKEGPPEIEPIRIAGRFASHKELQAILDLAVGEQVNPLLGRYFG